HLVEDLDALVGQPDLVGVRVHQCPPDVGAAPLLDGRVQLATDVLDRLLHGRQQRLETGEDALRRGGHRREDLEVEGGRTSNRAYAAAYRRPESPDTSASRRVT